MADRQGLGRAEAGFEPIPLGRRERSDKRVESAYMCVYHMPDNVS
jgi:hypothetical protein